MSVQLNQVPEAEVCEIAALILQPELGDDAPSAAELAIPFRIIREQHDDTTFDYQESDTKGQGFGPSESQWLSTIVIHLVAMLIWESMSKGVDHLRDTELYRKTREEILARAGRARAVVERLIDRVRDEVVRRGGDDES